MSQKYDSLEVTAGHYGKISGDAKTELWETYMRIQDMMVSGPTLGNNSVAGKFGNILTNIARMFGGSPYLPTLGSEAMNIPGTSYAPPVNAGTGMVPGGQAAFGLAPFSQTAGFKTGVSGGGAAPLSGQAGSIAQFSDSSPAGNSIGLDGFQASGGSGGNPDDDKAADWADYSEEDNLKIAGMIAGGASPLSGAPFGPGGQSFGQNIMLPAASLLGGVGSLLTTFGPYFGPAGLAAAAGGALANGLSGAVLASFQHVSGRLLHNTDSILQAKVKNLESIVQMMGGQETIIRKLMKDAVDGDKKSLDLIQ